MPNPQNIVKHKFKKGQTGNPNGRPREKEIKELLLTYFDDKKVNDILKSLHTKAIKGDIRAISEVLDRTLGKAQQLNLNQQLDEHGNPVDPSKVEHTVTIIKPAGK